MSIEQFIDSEVKSNDVGLLHEGDAAISDVRLLRPDGADPRLSRRAL